VEGYRHDYERWSKNNLINEILRLKKLNEGLLMSLSARTSQSSGRDEWHKTMAKARGGEVRVYAREDLVPVDLGGGFTVLVPPDVQRKESEQ
jgi:hypothetical protein